jgi:hypothetical protein
VTRGLIVLCTGGRDYVDREHVFGTLDAIHAGTVYAPPLAEGIHGIATLVHGGAGGADRIAERWAIERGVTIETYPADWTKYGKGAGPRRNTAMAARLVALGHWRGLVVAFPGARGTANMVAQARGKRLVVRACCDAHPLAVAR